MLSTNVFVLITPPAVGEAEFYCDLRSSLRRAVSKRTFYVSKRTFAVSKRTFAVSKRTFAVSKRTFAVSERIVFPRACHVWAMKLTCFRG